MVAYNSFATSRNEESFCWVRSGFEEAGAATEAAAIQASIETARREEHARALMRRAAQLTAVFGEQQALIA